MSTGTPHTSAGKVSGIQVMGASRTHRELHGRAPGGGNGWVVFHGSPASVPCHR